MPDFYEKISKIKDWKKYDTIYNTCLKVSCGVFQIINTDLENSQIVRKYLKDSNYRPSMTYKINFSFMWVENNNISSKNTFNR